MNDNIQWTNEVTANVAKWIDRDPAFYNVAINNRGGRNAFLNVRAFMKVLGFHKTPDNVSFFDESLDLKQLHNFIKEL
jgi:hypothetical protein